MNSVTRVLLVSLFCSSLPLLPGCSKQVPPYDGTGGTGGMDSKDIRYGSGQPGVITEEIGPQIDSLDSANSHPGASDSFDSPAEQGSDEYKQRYGRSSREFSPIYFDFDQSSLRSDQIPNMEHNGDYLKSNPSAKVVIEGNCDERGTNEYNLALGERRALVAKNYLLQLGIEPYRIRTVSYGEERPLFTETDEQSLSMNRRDDFILE